MSFSSSEEVVDEEEDEDSEEEPFLEEALPRVDVEVAKSEAGPLGLAGVLPEGVFGAFSCSSFILRSSSTSSLVTMPLAMASSEGISTPVSGSVMRTMILSTEESVVTSCLYMAAVSSLTSPLLTASSRVISSPVEGTSTMKEDIFVVVTPLSMILARMVPPRTDKKSPS